jgi:hypothetical protein
MLISVDVNVLTGKTQSESLYFSNQQRGLTGSVIGRNEAVSAEGMASSLRSQ